MRTKRTVLASIVVAVLLLVAPAQTQTRRFELDDLTRVVRVSSPQISPDGKSVAHVVSRADLNENRWAAEIALADIASGAMRTVASGRRGLSTPRWSPDGARLAYLASVGTGREAQAQIFVASMTAGEPRQITEAPMGVQQFAWAPDGRIHRLRRVRRAGEEDRAGALQRLVRSHQR